jgi:hypothetical protein
VNLGIMAGVIALLAGWWFVRNQALYGDMLLERTFKQKFGDAMTAAMAMQVFNCPDMGSYLGGLVLPTTFQTFWGAFGHLSEAKDFMGALPRGALDLPDWSAPFLSPLTFGALPPREHPAYPPASWLYPLLGLWTWAAVAGWARALRRGRREAEPSGSSTAPCPPARATVLGAAVARAGGQGAVEEPEGSASWRSRKKQHSSAAAPLSADPVPPAPLLHCAVAPLLSLYALFVLASFLRFNMEFFQAQGRYLFPALGPLAVAFAGGWLAWFSPRAARWGALALVLGMGLLALYALAGVIRPNF